MAKAAKTTKTAENGKPARSAKRRGDLFHYLKIAVMILIAAMIVVLCILSYRAGVLIFTNDGRTAENEPAVRYTIEIAQGESVLSIGRELREAGIIESGVVFFIQSKLFKCKIAPGTYTLSSDKSSKAILKYLHSEYEKARAESNAG